jgi:hypothetical protein
VLLGLIFAGPAAADQSTVHGQADLIDVSTLTIESDFSVFMRKDIPEDVRRAALRRLWVLMELPVQCQDLCHDTALAASDLAQLDKMLASVK